MGISLRAETLVGWGVKPFEVTLNLSNYKVKDCSECRSSAYAIFGNLHFVRALIERQVTPHHGVL